MKESEKIAQQLLASIASEVGIKPAESLVLDPKFEGTDMGRGLVILLTKAKAEDSSAVRDLSQGCRMVKNAFTTAGTTPGYDIVPGFGHHPVLGRVLAGIRIRAMKHAE